MEKKMKKVKNVKKVKNMTKMKKLTLFSCDICRVKPELLNAAIVLDLIVHCSCCALRFLLQHSSSAQQTTMLFTGIFQWRSHLHIYT